MPLWYTFIVYRYMIPSSGQKLSSLWRPLVAFNITCNFCSAHHWGDNFCPYDTLSSYTDIWFHHRGKNYCPYEDHRYLLILHVTFVQLIIGVIIVALMIHFHRMQIDMIHSLGQKLSPLWWHPVYFMNTIDLLRLFIIRIVYEQ